jgi:hypothetical protein
MFGTLLYAILAIAAVVIVLILLRFLYEPFSLISVGLESAITEEIVGAMNYA